MFSQTNLKIMNHQDFNTLLAVHKDMIYQVVRSRAYSEQDSDDIMQEVLLRIYQGMDSFKGNSNIKTWLYRIAVNASVDFYRKPWWKLKWLPLLNLENKPTASAGPFEQISHKQSHLKINAILKTLPTRQAEVFRLRFMEHLSLKDISDIKNLNISTIKTHLYRAVKKVRVELAGEEQP